MEINRPKKIYATSTMPEKLLSKFNEEIVFF
ncbi:MAG: hypothetical protein ACI9JT_002740, partial [Polaribacter sp.]